VVKFEGTSLERQGVVSLIGNWFKWPIFPKNFGLEP
jgi:hypothetical protein